MQQQTLGQAVRNAIETERAAESFYRLLGESTEDTAARDFLFAMARQEAEHAKAIDDLGQRLDAGELPIRADMNVELIETAPCWAWVDGMSLDHALQMALELEQHAWNYYETFAELLTGEVSGFYRELATHEAEHVRRIERWLNPPKLTSTDAV